MADKRGSLMVNGYKVGGKVDTTLSSTSTNPIENQAIFKELKKYVPRADSAINTMHYIASNEMEKYFKLATLKETQQYCSDPIQFEVAVRGNEISTLLIAFNNQPTVDPTLKLFTTDYYDGFYLAKSATSTWDLYCSGVRWSRISIKSIYNGTTVLNSNGVIITPNITPVDSIPSDAIQAVNPNLAKKIKITQITQEGYNALPSTIQSDNVYLITD